MITSHHDKQITNIKTMLAAEKSLPSFLHEF